MPFRIRQRQYVQPHCPPQQHPPRPPQHAQNQPPVQSQPQGQNPPHVQTPPHVQNQPPQQAQTTGETQSQPQAPADRAAVSGEARETPPASNAQEGSSLLQGLTGWLTGGQSNRTGQQGGGGEQQGASTGQAGTGTGPQGAGTGQPGASQGGATGQGTPARDQAQGANAGDYFRGLLQQVLPPLQLNDQERQQVTEAAETLRRLAGEDGRWDGRDLRNNLQQMQGSLRGKVDERIQQEFNQRTQGRTRLGTNIKRAIGSRVLDRNYGDYVQQGMGIARQTAMNGLVQGQDQMGMRRPNDYNAEANPWRPEMAQQPITAEQMERFGATMRMIEQKAKAAGYPAQSFQNGLPVRFLEMIRDGRLPVGVR